MTLIEAFVVAQQEYGIYGDWKAIHQKSGTLIGHGPSGNMYYAYDLFPDSPPALISQSERLETVIATYAEKYPDPVRDERWKVSRW